MLHKLKNRINLASLLLLLLTSCCLVALVNYFQKQHALENAEEKSLILLQHNLAIHTYYNKQLKPHLFALTDRVRDPAYFDPVWMSSTFAVRGIDRLYQQLAKEDYYYKEAAINARSPENEADEFERGFIERLKKEPALEKLSGVRVLKDKPFFFTLIRGESMEKTCLRCHSTPDKAPGGMVARYGSSRSFNRSDGELVSAISIRIPLSEAYQQANSFSMKLSLILLGMLLVTYYLQNRIIKRLVLSPLEQFRSRADAIANNPELIGSEIAGDSALEINVIAASFNKMSIRLKSFVENLEQTVQERTAQLAQREEQLRQSQKLESVGRLAGGVAHDFNNKLTVILGNAELAIMELPETGNIHERLQQIMQAARHSRDTTAQLLAFSQQQLRAPRPLDLSATIAHSLATLSLLIGKSVQIAFTPGENTWLVTMDPSQVDQIIMNLTLNAGESMPGGGCLSITVENVSVDETTAASHKDTAAGDYLLLTVSDTGKGIGEETLPHIFEPFFTTKDVGKGTGLGLATVYGIVVQNKGFIDVSSRLGQGTVFRIYLPRHTGD